MDPVEALSNFPRLLISPTGLEIWIMFAAWITFYHPQGFALRSEEGRAIVGRECDWCCKYWSQNWSFFIRKSRHMLIHSRTRYVTRPFDNPLTPVSIFGAASSFSARWGVAASVFFVPPCATGKKLFHRHLLRSLSSPFRHFELSLSLEGRRKVLGCNQNCCLHG